MPKTNFFFLIIFFLSFLSFKHVYSFAENIVKKTPLSSIHLPVTYTLKELEKSLNHHFQIKEKGILYKDDSFTNNNQDNLKVIARQAENIKVFSKDGKVITQIEVFIEVNYLINKKVKLDLLIHEFEYDFKWQRDLSFNIFVTFTTDVSLNENLETIPKTSWKYEWKSFPYIGLGPIQFQVLDEVEPIINNVVKGYAFNKIDQTLIKEIDIPLIKEKLSDLIKFPVEVSKEESVWMFVSLEKIFVGNIYIDSEAITFPFFINFYNHIGFSFDSLIPTLKYYKNSPPESFFDKQLNPTNQQFEIRNFLRLTTRNMEKILFDVISSRDFIIGENQYKMQITEIYLKSNKDLITAQVYLKSAVKNNILNYLVISITFNPYFDLINKKLRVRYLTYKVEDSDSIIITIVNALKKENFTKELRDGIAISFDAYFDDLKNDLNKKLADFQYDKQKKINLEIDELRVGNAYMEDNDLYLLIYSSGNVKMNLVNLF